MAEDVNEGKELDKGPISVHYLRTASQRNELIGHGREGSPEIIVLRLVRASKAANQSAAVFISAGNDIFSLFKDVVPGGFFNIMFSQLL